MKQREKRKKKKRERMGLVLFIEPSLSNLKIHFFWITMHQSHTPPGAMLVMFQKKPGRIYTISLQLFLVNLYLFYCIRRTCPDGFS
jgi:hypothetical protein